jgi:hypothetical protein
MSLLKCFQHFETAATTAVTAAVAVMLKLTTTAVYLKQLL